MIGRIIYEVRWWRWFLSGRWSTETLYGRNWLDKESRRLIIDRYEREHDAREPQYRGTYPHRRDAA